MWHRAGEGSQRAAEWVFPLRVVSVWQRLVGRYNLLLAPRLRQVTSGVVERSATRCAAQHSICTWAEHPLSLIHELEGMQCCRRPTQRDSELHMQSRMSAAVVMVQQRRDDGQPWPAAGRPSGVGQ